MRQRGETGPRGCLVQLTLSAVWLRWGSSRLLQPGGGVSISKAGGPLFAARSFSWYLVGFSLAATCPCCSSSRKHGAPSAGSSKVFLHLLQAPQGLVAPAMCLHSPFPAGRGFLWDTQFSQGVAGTVLSTTDKDLRPGSAAMEQKPLFIYGDHVKARPAAAALPHVLQVTASSPRPAAKPGPVLASLCCPGTPPCCPHSPDSASPLPGVTLACSWVLLYS